MARKAKRERERGDELATTALQAAVAAAQSMGLDANLFCDRILVELAAIIDDEKAQRKARKR